MKSLAIVLLFVATLSYGGGPKLGVHNYSYPARIGQDEERFWDRVRFGGNVGLQIGNPTNILVSPSIAYIPKANFLNDKLMVGLGVTYMYYRIKFTSGTYSSNIYGGRLFTRYLITNNIFAYVEHELLNAPVYDIYDNAVRQWVNSFFVGGGYLLSFSQRGGIMISVLYNLSWTAVHPIYASPWNIRIGFVF